MHYIFVEPEGHRVGHFIGNNARTDSIANAKPFESWLEADEFAKKIASNKYTILKA